MAWFACACRIDERYRLGGLAKLDRTTVLSYQTVGYILIGVLLLMMPSRSGGPWVRCGPKTSIDRLSRVVSSLGLVTNRSTV